MDAALSVLDVFGVTKLAGMGLKALGKEVLEEIGEHAGKKVIEETGERLAKELAEEAGERIVREVAEEAGERISREALEETGERLGREVAEETGEKISREVGAEAREKITKEAIEEGREKAEKEIAQEVETEVKEEVGEAVSERAKKTIADDVGESGSNSYSGEEWCRYFRETYGNNNVTWENATPSQLARSWQGSGKYIGIDEYTDVTVNKGTILYRGEPNGTEYFTTLDAIEQSERNATTIFEGLQVEKNPIHGYRGEMQGYLFNEDVASAYGITNANPQFGNGGLPQYYVPDVQDLISKGILTPVDNIKLYK